MSSREPRYLLLILSRFPAGGYLPALDGEADPQGVPAPIIKGLTGLHLRERQYMHPAAARLQEPDGEADMVMWSISITRMEGRPDMGI